MRNDIAVLITRAEAKGAALRIRMGQVEVRGLERLPKQLAEDLRTHQAEVREHLSRQETVSVPEEVAHLLAWASELAEQELILERSVTYVETPARTVTTDQASWYAAHYLNSISHARGQQQSRGWGGLTTAWWKEREQDAFEALERLREAMTVQSQVYDI